MGMFDFITEYFTAEGKFKRHVRRMKDRDSPPEDREFSAQWLAEEGSPKAIMGLLSRFEMSLSQTLKDRTEKEYVYQLLVNLGQPVVEPLDYHLRKYQMFAYPLRLLEHLSGEEAAIQMVYDLLEKEGAKTSFNPERKKTLLVWLAERRHPEAIAKVTPFLGDFDEEVRYSAAEVMIGQESDDALEPLLAALANPEEDSGRLKHRLCDTFRTRGWSTGDADLEGKLPNGFAAADGRIVLA